MQRTVVSIESRGSLLSVTVGTEGSILELDTLQQKGNFPQNYYLTERGIILLLVLPLLGYYIVPTPWYMLLTSDNPGPVFS